MKLLVILCVLMVAFERVLPAAVLKRDVSDKTKDEEDNYGPLDESEGNIQKDQVDYYDEVVGDVEEGPADAGGSNNVDISLVSKPEIFEEVLGNKVKLPCQASSKDELVRVWSKDSTLIYQGNINIGNKNNYKLLPNGALEVSLEEANDFGSYTCKLAISDSSQPEIVHQVIQKSGAVITELFTNDNKKVYDIGDTLSITCRATGYPVPRISWHKNDERLGTEGETLTIQNVKAKHAGSYRCLADNGETSHKHITISVNHPPMVTVDKFLVNSDHGSDAELVCEVHAYPSAVVNWQKKGQNIVTQENKIELKRQRNNERNILIIKNVDEKDFGQYSCVASNSYGKEERTVNLVKTPAIRQLGKKHSNESHKDVILQWRVESKQPISMHELQYRKKGETSWKTITPEVSEGDNDMYLIEHTLRNLEPGTYETRARSKNSHGWSNYSDITPFEGAKHGSHHPKAKHSKKEQKSNRTEDLSHDTPAQHRSEDMSPVGESTSSCTTLASSIALLLSASLIILLRP